MVGDLHPAFPPLNRLSPPPSRPPVLFAHFSRSHVRDAHPGNVLIKSGRRPQLAHRVFHSTPEQREQEGPSLAAVFFFSTYLSNTLRGANRKLNYSYPSLRAINRNGRSFSSTIPIYSALRLSERYNVLLGNTTSVLREARR